MKVFAPLELARLELQQTLDAQKTQHERNKLGQFATPPLLAADIAKYVKRLLGRRRQSIRFIDPAIGTGSFYSAVLQAFGPERIVNAAGIELDEEFATAARRTWTSTGLNVRSGDFTLIAPPPDSERFNLVLTNPPYVRHHHLSTQHKLHLRSLVENSLQISPSGLSGLYCYFLFLAHNWLSDDGIGVWLIPSEFMSVNYGSAVRDYLSRHVSLIHIHRFCPKDVQFSDALVSSAIVVFRKKPPQPGHRVQFSFGGLITKPDTVQEVSIDALRESSRWLSFPETNGHQREPQSAVSLGDLFTIKRGIATGSNGFFIMSREQAEELSIPRSWIRPILPSPRHMQQCVVESDDDGFPLGCRQLGVIDCNVSEDEIKKVAPAFWEYLAAGKAKQINKGYLASRRSPWYSQETRPPAPFVCTYMGRSSEKRESPFRLIWNKSQATVANTYLMLYPKGPLKQLLDVRPEAAADVFAAMQQITEAAFTDQSRVYGGGLHKIEPTELARVAAHSLQQKFTPPRSKKQTTLSI